MPSLMGVSMPGSAAEARTELFNRLEALVTAADENQNQAVDRSRIAELATAKIRAEDERKRKQRQLELSAKGIREAADVRDRDPVTAQAFRGWLRDGKLTPDFYKLWAVVEVLHELAGHAAPSAGDREYWERLHERCGLRDRSTPKVSEPLPVTPGAVQPAGGEPDGRRRRWVVPALAGVGVVVLAVAVGVLVLPDSGGEAAAAEPFSAEASTVVTGWCSTLVFDKPVAELGAAPKPPAEYARWAREHDGVDADPMGGFSAGRVLLNLQGTGSAPVTITSLGAEVVDRTPGPMKGTKVSGQCGSSTKGRLAEIDLETDPPKIIRSNADPNQLWGSDTNSTPLQFPYKISETDPELLLIIAEVRGTDTVSYRLHVGWTTGSNSGTKVIDNHGKPFRVGTADPKAHTYHPIQLK